jgi:hypothetical protein
MLLCGLVPAVASAASVTVRIESASASTLVDSAPITVLTTVVAPAGAPAGETCPGDSVIGAVSAAVSGDWNGTWDATNGWSLDRIKTATATLAVGRKWVYFINGVLTNDPPCHATLGDNDVLMLYTACITATSNCFSQGPIEMTGPSIMGPGAPINTKIWEYTVSLNSEGIGTSQRSTSAGASVVGPENSSTSDMTYGTGVAIVSIKTKGPALISAAKGSRAPDRLHLCITDGADGFCGTTVPPQNPFDPSQFCQAVRNDGYCNTPDETAPLGRIGFPVNGVAFTADNRPAKLAGTVDFDPSQTDHVDLRLMRQTTKVVKVYKKRKVWVKKRIHGKLVRRRVTKKKFVRRRKVVVCQGWSDVGATWKALKKCDASTATVFRAEGAEAWNYAFLNKLPVGKYTLDALAQDGSGNKDSTPEPGRNRSTFTVK